MLCVACVEWANLRRFGRVSSTRAGSGGGYAPRAERGRGLKAAAGRKRAGARLHAQTHSAGAGTVSEAHTGAGYAVARAGAVIISGRGTKKMSFPPKKKYKKRPPEELGRARARLYTDGRAFFACQSPAWARTLRAKWQNPRKKPPRKPPQNPRRRRSLRRNRANAAR